MGIHHVYIEDKELQCVVENMKSCTVTAWGGYIFIFNLPLYHYIGQLGSYPYVAFPIRLISICGIFN